MSAFELLKSLRSYSNRFQFPLLATNAFNPLYWTSGKLLYTSPSTELFHIAPGKCELLSPLMTFPDVPKKITFHAAQSCCSLFDAEADAYFTPFVISLATNAFNPLYWLSGNLLYNSPATRKCELPSPLTMWFDVRNKHTTPCWPERAQDHILERSRIYCTSCTNLIGK